jgi:hypothetical protein
MNEPTGFTVKEIHVFDPDVEEPEELPVKVAYAPLHQEDDFVDEELFS